MTKITNVNMEEMSVAKYFLTDSFGHPLQKSADIMPMCLREATIR